MSSFARGFKQSTGLTPYPWFLALCIDRSMELMIDDDRPLVDVALLSGFSDQSHFTRFITEKVGMSPGSWRGGKMYARLAL